MTLSSELLADLVGEPMRVGVQVYAVPFVGSISKHKSLVTSTEVFFVLVRVNGVCDFA